MWAGLVPQIVPKLDEATTERPHAALFVTDLGFPFVKHVKDNVECGRYFSAVIDMKDDFERILWKRRSGELTDNEYHTELTRFLGVVDAFIQTWGENSVPLEIRVPTNEIHDLFQTDHHEFPDVFDSGLNMNDPQIPSWIVFHMRAMTL